ncbi:hypothetical protein ACOTC5_31340 [Achromobacter xylosoxidans]
MTDDAQTPQAELSDDFPSDGAMAVVDICFVLAFVLGAMLAGKDLMPTWQMVLIGLLLGVPILVIWARLACMAYPLIRAWFRRKST